MPVEFKICGLKTPETVDAAVKAGARWVGFVAYPPSPRYVEADAARALGKRVPAGVGKVGLFVDAPDALIAERSRDGALDLLQLHGSESPNRVAEVRRRFRLPVMKVIKVASPADLVAAKLYVGIADRLLLDAAEPPASALPKGQAPLPGGNALPFDWTLLEGVDLGLPWMLAGGLTPDNVAEAIRRTGARTVDVSSGVESSRGVKSPDLIARFAMAVKTAAANDA